MSLHILREEGWLLSLRDVMGTYKGTRRGKKSITCIGVMFASKRRKYGVCAVYLIYPHLNHSKRIPGGGEQRNIHIPLYCHVGQGGVCMYLKCVLVVLGCELLVHK